MATPATAAGYGGGAPGATPRSAHLKVIAKHLRNPRGVTLGAAGIALVAEAGKGGSGPCVAGPEDPTSKVCIGLTAGVTAVAFGHQHRIISGLPSIGDQGTGANAVGLAHVTITPHGLVGALGLGGDVAKLTAFGSKGRLSGWVAHLAPGGVHRIADLVAYEQKHNPDAGDPGSVPDSDPYATTYANGKIYAADAGGNDVLAIDRSGHISTVAVLHATMQTAPPFLGLPPGTKIPQQAVPDSIISTPGGTLYVGTLTGFPFTPGTAAVYKIVPGHAPTVYAGGFTNIIDIAFDRWGDLYVLEIAKNGLLGDDPTGALIKVDPQGHRTEIAAGQLVAPGGLAVANNGTIYVTTNSVSATDGQLVVIRP
jgi:hypothetical protein